MKNLVNPKPAICYTDIDKIPEKYGKMPSSKEVKVVRERKIHIYTMFLSEE